MDEKVLTDQGDKSEICVFEDEPHDPHSVANDRRAFGVICQHDQRSVCC